MIESLATTQDKILILYPIPTPNKTSSFVFQSNYCFFRQAWQRWDWVNHSKHLINITFSNNKKINRRGGGSGEKMRARREERGAMKGSTGWWSSPQSFPAWEQSHGFPPPPTHHGQSPPSKIQAEPRSQDIESWVCFKSRKKKVSSAISSPGCLRSRTRGPTSHRYVLSWRRSSRQSHPRMEAMTSRRESFMLNIELLASIKDQQEQKQEHHRQG